MTQVKYRYSKTYLSTLRSKAFLLHHSSALCRTVIPNRLEPLLQSSICPGDLDVTWMGLSLEGHGLQAPRPPSQHSEGWSWNGFHTIGPDQSGVSRLGFVLLRAASISDGSVTALGLSNWRPVSISYHCYSRYLQTQQAGEGLGKP